MRGDPVRSSYGLLCQCRTGAAWLASLRPETAAGACWFRSSSTQLAVPGLTALVSSSRRSVRGVRASVVFPAEARVATGLSSQGAATVPGAPRFRIDPRSEDLWPFLHHSRRPKPAGEGSPRRFPAAEAAEVRGRLASGALGTSCSPPLGLTETRQLWVEELWTGRCASRPSGSIAWTLQECSGSLPSGPCGGTWNPVPASGLGIPVGRGLLVYVCSVPAHWAASPKRGGRRAGPSCPLPSAEAGVAGVTSAPVCRRRVSRSWHFASLPTIRPLSAAVWPKPSAASCASFPFSLP